MCDCITKMNTILPKGNTVGIAIFWDGSPSRAMIETVPPTPEPGKRRKRDDKVNLIATYCPFCGEKYPLRKPANNVKTPTRHYG